MTQPIWICPNETTESLKAKQNKIMVDYDRTKDSVT